MSKVKRIAAVLLCLVMITGCFMIPGSAATNGAIQPFAIITALSINVRDKAGTDGNRIGGLTIGKEVDVYDTVTSGDSIWYKIKYDGKDGYIDGSNAVLVKNIGMVNAGAVNVRTEPSKSATRVTELTLGDEVYICDTVKADGETWYKIYAVLGYAYVMANYVSIMTMPVSDVSATWNNDIILKVVGHNIPAGYTLYVDGKAFSSEGTSELVCPVPLGVLTESRDVRIIVRDKLGVARIDRTATVKVNNGFIGKLIAYIGYIFSGFKWGGQTVQIG